MKKALHEIENKVKLVDIVIELVDARAAFSSRNPLLDNVINNKPRLLILSKSDLADDEITKAWKKYYVDKGYLVLEGNITKKSILNSVVFQCEKLSKTKREKEIRKGMKPQPIRIMVLGIPNVGKSTLINSMTNSSSASVQNKPGHTRSEQWIRINKDFELLDTPGVLPMSYKDDLISKNIALIGSIRDDIIPIDSLSRFLLSIFRSSYPHALEQRYGISDIVSDDETFKKIALRRGLLTAGEADINKAQLLLLNEFKNGLLGKFSLEKI